MPKRAPKHNTRAGWAEDVELLIAEAFGDPESAGVPEPAVRATTAPYRFGEREIAPRQRRRPDDA